MRPVSSHAHDQRPEPAARRQPDRITPVRTTLDTEPSPLEVLLTITGSPTSGGVVSSNLAASLQRTYGNQSVQRLVQRRISPNRDRSLSVQRVYLKDGAKVTDDTFDYSLPNVVPAVKVVSFVKRHTIRGFVKSSVTKELNTVLLRAIEMTRVALAAYNEAWKPELGRLNVTDGTTFVSEGVKWGINAMPSNNSIHIWPESGSPLTTDVAKTEKAPLGSYINLRGQGKSHQEAEQFALTILEKTKGSEVTFRLCTAALVAMNDV
jgi:hypothetical protein